MPSIRAEELTRNRSKFRRHWLDFGVRYDNTAFGNNLSVRTDIADFERPGLLVQHKRTQVLTRRCVSVIKFPVQRVNADRVREEYGSLYVCLNVLLSLSVPTDDDTGVALARCKLQVRVSFEVVLRYGVTDEIGRNHALVILGMFLEVPFQNDLGYG